MEGVCGQVRLLATGTDVTKLLQSWSSACYQALKDWGASEQQVEEHSQAFRKQRVAGNEVCALIRQAAS